MVSERKLMSLNPDSTIHSPFQLNILGVEPNLSRGNLNSYMRGRVRLLIKFTGSYKLKLL
jgi:hypothetical protein